MGLTYGYRDAGKEVIYFLTYQRPHGPWMPFVVKRRSREDLNKKIEAMGKNMTSSFRSFLRR